MEVKNNEVRKEAVKLRTQIILVRGSRCEECEQKFYYPFGRMVRLHHKIKICDGGTNNDENLLVLCASCHSKIHNPNPFIKE